MIPARNLGLEAIALDTIDGQQLTPWAVQQFIAMREAARADGVDISIASGFRSVERQTAIWNHKMTGQRTVLDDQGRAIDAASWQQLSATDRIHAVCRYSAIPGLSRHHWGTDLDVYDAHRCQQQGHQLALVACEYDTAGPCYELHCWLKLHAENYGFFFPYRTDMGGVAPEPWHLSFWPESHRMMAQLASPHYRAQLSRLWHEQTIALADRLIADMDALIARYAMTISTPSRPDWLQRVAVKAPT